MAAWAMAIVSRQQEARAKPNRFAKNPLQDIEITEIDGDGYSLNRSPQRLFQPD
jgi:hypothetical protein